MKSSQSQVISEPPKKGLLNRIGGLVKRKSSSDNGILDDCSNESPVNSSLDLSSVRTPATGSSSTLSLVDMVRTDEIHSGTPLGSRRNSYLCSPENHSTIRQNLPSGSPFIPTSSTMKIDQDRSFNTPGSGSLFTSRLLSSYPKVEPLDSGLHHQHHRSHGTLPSDGTVPLRSALKKIHSNKTQSSSSRSSRESNQGEARKTSDYDFDFDDSVSIAKGLVGSNGEGVAVGMSVRFMPKPSNQTDLPDTRKKLHHEKRKDGSSDLKSRNLPAGGPRSRLAPSIEFDSQKILSNGARNDATAQADDKSVIGGVSDQTVSSAYATVASTRSAISAPPTPWNGGQRKDFKHWTDDKTIVSDSCLLAEEEAPSEEATMNVAQELHNTVLTSVLNQEDHLRTGALPGISEQPWMQYLDSGTTKGVPQDLSASMRRVALQRQHNALHSLLEEQRSLREPTEQQGASASNKGKERLVLPDIVDLSLEDALPIGIANCKQRPLGELLRSIDETQEGTGKIRKNSSK